MKAPHDHALHDNAPPGQVQGPEHECPRTVDFDSDAPAAANRRSFLRTTALLGAGTAALGMSSTSVAFAGAAVPGGSGARGAWKPDTEGARFTVVVMPDTQYLFDGDSIHPAPMEASFRYVLDNRKDENIAFLAHLGDITQNGLPQEFAAVSSTFGMLDRSGFGYSVLAGNHDIRSSTDDQRGKTAYLNTFSPARFAGSPTYRGASADGYNSYHIFRAAGREWLVLALDWRLSKAGFAWANAVIAQHRTLPVIVTTHDIAYSDEAGKAHLSDNGQHLWNDLISGNDQVFLALGGHNWPPGNSTLTNKAGHDVHLHVTDYQNRYYGGAAMIRTYRFDTARNTIDVATFSPWIQGLAANKRNELAGQEIELTSSVDYFSIPLDFTKRFSGFAPVPPRPARPAKDMLVRGTVAYWRFDSGNADGSVFPDAQTVKDLSGRGNDLTKTVVPGSSANSLTWSAQHHPDQPGHGSLYLGGQGNPVQGAYLQTVPGAPINADTFSNGYTFEAFFKLPANWTDTQNAWSALLSRWGMSGEAGKTGPNTDPQEPIATLSLSGGRELQWCVYPVNQTGPTTNWGHELPLDAWWHVAVVNDGRLSKMYVDGCELVRNPSTPAVGLTTLNHPWLIGGYEYAGVINQVFHGWIGDVRIVNRALKVSEFMNA